MGDKRLRLLLRLMQKHWKRVMLVTLIGTALAATASWTYFRVRPPSPKQSSCSGCGSTERTGASPYSVDALRQAHYAQKHDRIYQGLPEGETALWMEGSEVWDPESRGALIYFLRVPESGIEPERSFPLALFSEWVETLRGLDLVLVLGGYVGDVLSESIRRVLYPAIAMRVDTDGAIFSTFDLDPETDGFGFLLDADGVVLFRLRGLRTTNAASTLAALRVYAQEGALPDPTYAFSMVHPLRVAQGPHDLEIADEGGKAEGFERVTRGRPTLVYLFSPECQPCSLCSETTSALAVEYDGRVDVIGLSYTLSDSVLASAATIGRAYLSLFSEERQASILNLPTTEEGRRLYAKQQAEELDAYMGGLPTAFPVAMDYDRRFSGALGMGGASLPSWALFNAEGALVDIIPGAYDTVYDNREPVSTCYPTLLMLQTRINRVLDSLGSRE